MWISNFIKSLSALIPPVNGYEKKMCALFIMWNGPFWVYDSFPFFPLIKTTNTGPEQTSMDSTSQWLFSVLMWLNSSCFCTFHRNERINSTVQETLCHCCKHWSHPHPFHLLTLLGVCKYYWGHKLFSVYSPYSSSGHWQTLVKTKIFTSVFSSRFLNLEGPSVITARVRLHLSSFMKWGRECSFLLERSPVSLILIKVNVESTQDHKNPSPAQFKDNN